MGRPSLQRQRREQILDGLMDAAVATGLRAVSVSDVARAAELPRSAVHYFFASKEEMEVAFVRRIGDRYVRNLRAELDRLAARYEDGDRKHRDRAFLVGDLIGWHFAAPEEKAERLLNVWLDFWGIAATRETIRDEVYAIQERARDVFVDALLLARPLMRVRPREDMRTEAAALLALVEGGLLQWRLARAAGPFDASWLGATLARSGYLLVQDRQPASVLRGGDAE